MTKLFKFLSLPVLLLVPATLTATSAQSEEKTKIVIAMEGDFSPWNFSGPDGTLQGFEVDLYKDLCRRLEAPCETTVQAFDGLIPALTAGRFDAIMSAMTATEKREQVISFSVPYASYASTFATLEDSGLTNLPETKKVFSLVAEQGAVNSALKELREKLSGRTIGVQGSTSIAAFINDNFKDVATIREYKTGDEPVLDLLAGRSDIVFAGAVYLSTATRKPENKGLTLTGPAFEEGFLGKGAAIGLPKTAENLKVRFDRAINEAKADGTIRALSEQWFGIDVTPR